MRQAKTDIRKFDMYVFYNEKHVTTDRTYSVRTVTIVRNCICTFMQIRKFSMLFPYSFRYILRVSQHTNFLRSNLINLYNLQYKRLKISRVSYLCKGLLLYDPIVLFNFAMYRIVLTTVC